MKRKENALHELRNVKFVVGNGFDLFCGLKTKYQDFFAYWKGKYAYISEWIEGVASIIYQNPHLRTNPMHVYMGLKNADKINCWDVFFAMFYNKPHDYLWCDIESKILISLADEEDPDHGNFDVRWEDVYGLMHGDSFEEKKYGSFIMASFMLHKLGSAPTSREAFYECLLEQLKEFEDQFGRYITKQHIAWNQFLFTFNDRYIRNARFVLTYLCDAEDIAGIDCFNYGFTPEAKFYDKCKFVNGDCLNPIFGIDSVFGPEDPRYIFTKTYRRIEWDMNLTSTAGGQSFDNAIVFGHSLSSHDHNYFFPILDELEMTNFASKKKLVIAYSIFDPSKEVAIKKTLRKSIYALFTAYADYSGRGANSSRLLDSLTTQGRVIICSIPDAPEKPSNFLEDNTDFLNHDSPKEMVEQYWQAYLEHGTKF